ncbi:MAG: hypothetical protein N2255_03885 [Kiritimatiellae bacterium]|nr:hypothetical protein [Kiritimatiellia bacterium]
MFCQFLETIYGELRGYHRHEIRKAIRRYQCVSSAALAWQERFLFEKRVRDAIQRFPAYAAKVRETLGFLPSPDDPICLELLPIWTRTDQRKLFAATPGPPIPGAFVHKTGGSTGMPLRYWVTRESWEWRTAASDRGYEWVGAGKGVPSVYVWGTPVYPPAFCARLKAKISARLQRRWFFDSFRFGPEEKRKCCDTINRLRPRALVGYAGNLVELARFVRENKGMLRWKSPVLVTAAEGVSPQQRTLLLEYLADDVFVSYGSREFMLIAMECPAHKGLHISSDVLSVEVVDEKNRRLPHGEVGRLLVTDLRNLATPFIRYEIGDFGALAPPDEPCPCGLPFPRLLSVDGRIQEFITLPNGQRLTTLFIPHLMKEFEWIEGYQIAQVGRLELEVRLVTTREIPSGWLEPLRTVLQDKVGPEMVIRFKPVESLERNPSGKIPIVLNSREEKGAE